jgi:DNA-binding transcriptional LysR family regulator
MAPSPSALALDLDQLRCFLAVVEHGSITRAASSLHLTQPAVSQKIRQLESALGAPLLARTSRGVTATAAGSLLAEGVPAVLAALRGLERRVRGSLEPDAGQVTIGSSDTAALYLLPEVLARFRARHPAVGLTLVNRESRDLARLCVEGLLDFALITLPHAPPRALAARVVARHALVAAGPRRHHDLATGVIEREQFTRVPLVLLARGSSTRTAIERYLESLAAPPQVALESSNIEVIKRYVRDGLGLSLLPEWVFSSRDRRELALARLKPRAPPIALALVHSAAKGLLAPARALHDQIADDLVRRSSE